MTTATATPVKKDMMKFRCLVGRGFHEALVAFGLATGSTRTTLGVADDFPLTSAQCAGLRVKIVGGTGVGQTRNVTGFNAKNHTLAIDSKIPWADACDPDDTSEWELIQVREHQAGTDSAVFEERTNFVLRFGAEKYEQIHREGSASKMTPAELRQLAAEMEAAQGLDARVDPSAESTLDAMTIPELRAMAEEEEIDLGNAKTKAEIVRAIMAAQGKARA